MKDVYLFYGITGYLEVIAQGCSPVNKSFTIKVKNNKIYRLLATQKSEEIIKIKQ